MSVTVTPKSGFQALLGLLLLGPALALGAVHPVVLTLFLVPAVALMALVALDPKWRQQLTLDLPGAIFILLILFTLFQIIPLPAPLVELISPAAYEVRSRAFRPLDESCPSLMPLSLDVIFTVTELAKLFVYLAVYWACRIWVGRYGSRFVINAVLVTGGLSAAVFLTHQILSLNEVYGLYQPVHVSMNRTVSAAPLINSNHLAALLGLGATVAIGRALATSGNRLNRLPMIGLAAVIGGALLLTLSRGGIATFVIGQLIFVSLMILVRLLNIRHERGIRSLTWLPVGLALSLGLGLLAAEEAIIGEFVHGDMSKLDFLSEGMGLIGQFPAVGVGRGAFWVGFPMVSDLAAKVTFTHAENAVIQLLADYGVLFGTVALVGLGVPVARRLKRLPDRPVQMAVLAALVAFGIHNLVDFNMELPGVAVLAVALLAVLQADRSLRRRRGSAIDISPKTRLAVAGLGALTAVYMMVYGVPHSLEAEERALKSAFDKRDPRPFAKDNLRQIIARHPANWYVPFLVGAREFHTRQANPLPWLARALELNPSSAVAHYYVGRTLLRSGRLNQAMLEFRLAARGNPSLATPIAERLTSRYANFTKLAPIAATGTDKVVLWGALAQALAAKGHDAQAEQADLAILEAHPRDARSLGRHANRLATRGESAAATALAERLAALPDYGPAGAMLKAKFLRHKQQYAKALTTLEDQLKRTPKHPALLRQLAWTYQRAGDHDKAIRIASRLRALSTNIVAQRQAALLSADLEAAGGKIQAAMAKYQFAFSLDSSDTRPLVKVVDLAERHGDWMRAVDALRQLTAVDPLNKTWQERLEQIEAAQKRHKLLNQ